jgi:hypothetical protein
MLLSTPKVEDKKNEKLLSSTTGALTEHFQKFKNSTSSNTEHFEYPQSRGQKN